MPVANVWSKQRVVLNSLNTRTLPTGKRIKSWTNIQVKSINLFSEWFGGTTSLTKRFKNGFTKEFLIRARHFLKKIPNTVFLTAFWAFITNLGPISMSFVFPLTFSNPLVFRTSFFWKGVLRIHSSLENVSRSSSDSTM